MKPIIKLNKIEKIFNKSKILREINIEVSKGESLVIIGTSGSGKSVLMKCLLGIIEISKGDIIIDDYNSYNSSKKNREDILRRFGVTFQGGALFDSISIWENVSFRLARDPFITNKEVKERVEVTLKSLNLDNSIMYLFPSQLSGGMQKRVAIARAIIDQPDFLIFDEPTAGLDPITGSSINELILDNVKRLGSTSITITHDMASVRKIADKVAMIHNGIIEWQGDIKNLENSNNEIVHKFINGYH
jgi:phospholipid/cholesterol/gamma-HCH transport system ATP-binding protein